VSHKVETTGVLAEMTEDVVKDELVKSLKALGFSIEFDEKWTEQNGIQFNWFASRFGECCARVTSDDKAVRRHAGVVRYETEDGDVRYRFEYDPYCLGAKLGQRNAGLLSQELTLQISESQLRRKGYRNFERIRDKGRTKLRARA
jgi:hypothetical protein